MITTHSVTVDGAQSNITGFVATGPASQITGPIFFAHFNPKKAPIAERMAWRRVVMSVLISILQIYRPAATILVQKVRASLAFWIAVFRRSTLNAPWKFRLYAALIEMALVEPCQESLW